MKKTKMWVNLSEYGRRRGCSSAAVKKAITTGRLKESARKKENGKWEVNPDAADREWALNTKIPQDPTAPVRQAIPGADGPTKAQEQSNQLYAARTQHEDLRAKMAQLKYEEMAGRLVPVDAVKDEWLKMIAAAKTKFLALPAKFKTNFPHLTRADAGLMDEMIREVLEDLAGASP